jgi:putative membrane protein
VASTSDEPVAAVSDRGFFGVVAVVSAAALAFIGYVLVIRGGSRDAGVDLHLLPAVNAGLNATAATLLVVGRVAIARGARRFHQWCMVAAFGVSSLFLVSYLTYHWVHGDTRFGGAGAVRVAYLLMLASHIVLSMTIVPLALTSLWFAYDGRFARHRRVAAVTFPIWLYVSVTGVLIFWMLRAWA